MALINCPECQKDVSDTAKNCPHCGFCIKKHLSVASKTENNYKSFKEILCTPKTYIVLILLFAVYIFWGYWLFWEENLFWFSSIPVIFFVNWIVFRKHQKRIWICTIAVLPLVLASLIIPMSGMSFGYDDAFEYETIAGAVSFCIMYVEIGMSGFWLKSNKEELPKKD